MGWLTKEDAQQALDVHLAELVKMFTPEKFHQHQYTIVKVTVIEELA
jgi:hypothetical protein